MHDRGADRERRTCHAQTAEAELGDAGEHRDGAGRAPSVAVDEFGGDDGESGGGAADLERGAAEAAGEEPADGGGDQAGLEWRAGGEGDAEGQGEGDQEDRDGGRPVGARDAEAPGLGRRGLWGWWMRFVRFESAARVGTQADMFPVFLRGSAVAEQVVPRLDGRGSGRGRGSRRAAAGYLNTR
ncbi:hypothetical protein SAV14893_040710 [Streptomyces avermitilis]|uniref:Uncharacterized protein n=1 Tax=Streptomyces avermitilis TaxID=33903 RepID=A0A4D4MSJ9_STRAX|nr:hypothetical protein SAV14893_040710 [Streptomyces avermitilis]GDY75138.1 hypothetical protein SAV31267_046230 [Streptomyces avermitilis]